jgi:hypothetical protein
MVLTLTAIAAGAALCLALGWLVRKICIEIGQHQQRVFIRETLAASPHSTERIIVSLSTLPDRIANLRPTLTCLLEQTRPPDEIVLAIPHFSLRQQRGYTVPAWLSDFPRVRLLRVEKDWGPATKFIPAIQAELAAGRPDTRIVVVDDDRDYPRDAVACYQHFSAEWPEAALCFRGALMPRDHDWDHARMRHGNRVRRPRRVAVITGCGSYLIKPRFFTESLWDYAHAPGAAFYMDDIWISGWLERAGVEKYVTPSSRRLLNVRAQARTMTLHEVPGGRQPNNNQVIAFFRQDWRDYEE